jgi:transaldolase
MMMAATQYKSPLHEMICTTPTALWNDSCSIAELTYAIENGAVGATANPVIVGEVLKKEMHLWKDRLPQMIAEMPHATEDDIAWKLCEEMSVQGAKLLLPAFEASRGHNGRLSIQTDPRYYRNAQLIVEQAVHFNTLAPNMIVKIPVTKAGVEAIEEATYRGVSINATVSFTLPQALAVAEAVERGLKRREREGQDIAHMGPVCTLMIGRLDDWMKVLAERDGIVANPVCPEWAGVAVMKKAYRIYQERGYRLRLLAAAYRNHLHWTELVGGDVVLTMTYPWQKRFNATDIKPLPRMDKPVDPAIVGELYTKFPDFRRAYDEDGMAVEEFDAYGATRRTLRQFLKAYADLAGTMRDLMCPNPDVK